jgi:hypothetical protein
MAPCHAAAPRDESRMLFFTAPAMAALLSLSVGTVRAHKHHRHVPARTYSRHLSSPREQTLQRRVVRMTSLALLVRREAMLHDFLLAARTETPIMSDASAHALMPGVDVFASTVALDFLGSPIIRAKVHNALARSLTAVIVADVVDVRGARGRAATEVTLRQGETRSIELLCPATLSPASLIWSIVPL